MAELIGMGTAVFGALEVAHKIVSKTKNVIEAIRDAPRHIRSVFVQTSSLATALQSLEFLLTNDDEDAIKDPDGIAEAIRGCKATLQALDDELGDLDVQVAGSRSKKTVAAISWTWKAAAVEKLLNEVDRYRSIITLGLTGYMAQDVKYMKGGMSRVEQALSASERGKICDWIEGTNPSPLHEQAVNLHESHTSEWALRTEEWNTWLDENSPKRTLWIHGIPGAGKTCLASFLIRQCAYHIKSEKLTSAECLYYYCSYRNNQDESLPLLKWLVSQLCRSAACVIPEEIVSQHRKKGSMERKTLEALLVPLLNQRETVYLFVDAVDESTPRHGLLALIGKFIRNAGYSKLRLVATSRRYMEIEEVLSNSSAVLSMKNDEVDKDIRTFFIAEMDRRVPGWSPDIKKEALEAVVAGSQGMFRWAACQLDLLRRRQTPEKVRRALKNLPATLYDTYERILHEIDREDQPIAHVILIWICGNDRILQAGYSSLSDDFYLSVPALIEHLGTLNANSDRRYDLEDILDICGCLITDVPRDRGSKDAILKLAHYTVLEFLTLDRTRDSKTLACFAITDNTISRKYFEPMFNIEGRVENTYFPIFDDDSQDLQAYACMATALSRRFLQDLIVGNDRLWELQLVCLEKIANEHETNQPLHYFARHISSFICTVSFEVPLRIMAIPCGSGTTVKEAAVLASLLQANLLEIAERYIEGKDFLSLLQAPLSLWRAENIDAIPLKPEPLQETGQILAVLFSSMFAAEEHAKEQVDSCETWEIFQKELGDALQFIARRLLKEGRQDVMARLVHDAARTVEAQAYFADIVLELFKHHNGCYGQWPPEIDCCIRTVKDSSCWFLQPLISMLAHGEDGAFDPCEGGSALKLAVFFLDCTAVRMLLEAGADPNFIDDAGWKNLPSPREQTYFLQTFPDFEEIVDRRAYSTLRIVRAKIAWLERQLSGPEPEYLESFGPLTAEDVEDHRRRLETCHQIEELLLQYRAVEY